MYPLTAAYDHGFLEVGDGNRIYWEQRGNPEGKAAVVLHGGPGTGCRPGMESCFNPAVYRVILFDQRGSGKSEPHASVYATDMRVNTTVHLLADMERLREHLGVERWLVRGGSWGATLGIAYAETFPHRVTALLLSGVTTTRRSEIDWLYHGVAPLFPVEWRRFRAGVPEAEKDSNLVEAYHRLLESPDPTVRQKAAQDWCDWEAALLSAQADYKPKAYYYDPAFQMGFARTTTHYFRVGAWLEEGILLRNASRLKGIPGAMIHGRLDLDAPLTTAWELSQVWQDAELVVVGSAGHSFADPGLMDALVAATDRLAHTI